VGVQASITDGERIYFRVALKPPATIMREHADGEGAHEATTIQGCGGHDPCVRQCAVPMVEAMTALI
jgi:chorismate synthase